MLSLQDSQWEITHTAHTHVCAARLWFMHTHAATYWEYSMRAANNVCASSANKAIGKGIFYIAICVLISECVYEGVSVCVIEIAHFFPLNYICPKKATSLLLLLSEIITVRWLLWRSVFQFCENDCVYNCTQALKIQAILFEMIQSTVRNSCILNIFKIHRRIVQLTKWCIIISPSNNPSQNEIFFV